MSNNYNAYDDGQSNPALSARVVDRKPLIIVAIIGIVLMAFFALIIYLLGVNSVTTETVRDISLILLAVLMIVLGFIMVALISVLVYLTLKVIDLVQLLNTEVRPIFDKVNHAATTTSDTANTLQKRVSFVSDEAVKPVINAVSSVYAIKSIFTTLFKR